MQIEYSSAVFPVEAHNLWRKITVQLDLAFLLCYREASSAPSKALFDAINLFVVVVFSVFLVDL